jgi:hypothetical protein
MSGEHMNAEVARYQAAPIAIAHERSIEELLAQANKIKQAMEQAMEVDQHYGIIPGARKPSLWKPGAEKLCLLFRLDPQYHSEPVVPDAGGGGHLTVKSVCTLWHIPTGQRFGSGEASCSTRESKYAYRQASRKCPTCGKEAIIKGKAEWGGGWLCFKKKDGCGAKFKDGDAAIEGQETGRVANEDLADSYNCVTPDTRLLTHDLRWVPAGKIATGDVLIGVQEQMGSQYSRHLAIGEATVYGTREEFVYEVSCDDGRTVRCNGEHQWLVKKRGLKGTEWVSTEDIHREWSQRRGRPRHWAIMSLCAPWDEDPSREAGYLAGLLDADGSLGINQARVLFAQQENGVLQTMASELGMRGFSVGKSRCKTVEELARCRSKKQVYGLRILGGLAEQMRALGSLRPPRLLERWLTRIDLSARRLEGRGSGAGRPARITAITPVGMQDIVLLGSSCGTYIAEGLVAHNTVLKMANKRALVAGILNVTAASDVFTQDLEDFAREEADEPPPPAQKAAPRARTTAAPPTDDEVPVAHIGGVTVEDDAPLNEELKRSVLLAKVKGAADKLGWKADKRAAAWDTYCQGMDPRIATLEALNDLYAYLLAQRP